MTVDCGFPAAINNALGDPGTRNTYNSVRNYLCNEGFTKNGNGHFIKCLETGSWSVPGVQCDPVGNESFFIF